VSDLLSHHVWTLRSQLFRREGDPPRGREPHLRGVDHFPVPFPSPPVRSTPELTGAGVAWEGGTEEAREQDAEDELS